ncbi:hypothetical protein B0H19DRAFT_1080690 [Mycena capillaripes]|nr:hypothetical protein B0H19DRAFT_1080690 [Mycena capillaripes]
MSEGFQKERKRPFEIFAQNTYLRKKVQILSRSKSDSKERQDVASQYLYISLDQQDLSPEESNLKGRRLSIWPDAYKANGQEPRHRRITKEHDAMVKSPRMESRAATNWSASSASGATAKKRCNLFAAAFLRLLRNRISRVAGSLSGSKFQGRGVLKYTGPQQFSRPQLRPCCTNLLLSVNNRGSIRRGRRLRTVQYILPLPAGVFEPKLFVTHIVRTYPLPHLNAP